MGPVPNSHALLNHHWQLHSVAHTPSCPSSTCQSSSLPSTFLTLSPILPPSHSLDKCTLTCLSFSTPPPLPYLPARPQGDIFAGCLRKTECFVLCTRSALWSFSEFLARKGGRGPGAGITQPGRDPGSVADVPRGSGSLSSSTPFLP